MCRFYSLLNLLGCFAMAYGMKNGGIILGPILTIFLGAICVHAQHILLNCSAAMKEQMNLEKYPDYAETVELVFLRSNNDRWKKCARPMRSTCNAFICVTQLGFCCIYFLFIGTNLKQVLDYYGLIINFYVLISITLIPIWLSALITNLKYLGNYSL